MKKIPKFKNPAFFEHAFVHRSYLNETKEVLESNERLEFLGDSILSFVVSSLAVLLAIPVLSLASDLTRSRLCLVMAPVFYPNA